MLERNTNRVVLLLLSSVLFSCALFGQDDLGLVVRGGSLDQVSSTYSFELVNTYAKPIAGWTMTIEHRMEGAGSMRQFFAPDDCSLATALLPPNGVLRCKLYVNRWNTPADAPETAHVTSVLFADGTAAGDLDELDATIEERWSRYRELQYWHKRSQERRSQPDLVSALRSLLQNVHAEPPALPDGDGYSRAAVMVRTEVISSIANGLRQIEQHRFPAERVFDGLILQLQAQEEVAAAEANMFPRPQARLSTESVFQPSWRELRKPSMITVLRFEENRHTLRVVIRNDAGRPLASWGFKVTDSRGDAASASRGPGNELLQPGWVDVLELEPPPAAAYRVVTLEATFGGASAGHTPN